MGTYEKIDRHTRGGQPFKAGLLENFNMQSITMRALVVGAALFMMTGASVVGLTPTAVHAQDGKAVANADYKVEVAKPKNWEQSTGNEKAVAIFTDPKTQSQIEVVPTKLMTPDVSDVFFETFHKTLTESNFNKDGETKQQKIGDYEGKLTAYNFSHSGVTLRVHVFSFVRESTAWLVVGYMQDNVQKDIEPQFRWTIENMKFSES